MTSPRGPTYYLVKEAMPLYLQRQASPPIVNFLAGVIFVSSQAEVTYAALKDVSR